MSKASDKMRLHWSPSSYCFGLQFGVNRKHLAGGQLEQSGHHKKITAEEEEEMTSVQPHQADWMDTTCVKGHRGTHLTNGWHECLFHPSRAQAWSEGG